MPDNAKPQARTPEVGTFVYLRVRESTGTKIQTVVHKARVLEVTPLTGDALARARAEHCGRRQIGPGDPLIKLRVPGDGCNSFRMCLRDDLAM
ncbi:MAG: hypothetical protein GC131_02910 [Alphaproteobacteria bacterium]|nr:hypothetical protein [Alphaproteobacteria bacterium]